MKLVGLEHKNIYNLPAIRLIMPTQDTTQLKEKIILVIKTRGPSLPVHIASETGMSMLFSSAFLSELLSEKKLKLSNMRVGSSPLYLIPGQEPLLENFAQHLKSKEKEAFSLLKEEKILKDSDQLPAIRVAIRAIHDFAIPFKKNDEIYWRYFTTPKSEEDSIKVSFTPKEETKEEPEPQPTKQPEPQSLDIFNKETKEKPVKKPQPTKKPVKKRTVSQKKQDKFFNKIKEFLSENSIEILDIESFNKNDLILRVRDKGQEKLLIGFNKKRITEIDILKASKKAIEENLSYIILSLGTPLKKLTNLIDAVKNLSSIKKLK